MAKEKLSETSKLVLVILSIDGPQIASRFIGSEFGISKATVYRNLKILISKGLVKVKHNIYTITKRGIEVVDKFED